MKNILFVLGSLLTFNAFAECGLHIKNLDKFLKKEPMLTLELIKFAEKKDFILKFTSDELKDGDLIIDQLITQSPGGTYYHIRAKNVVKDKLTIGYAGKIFTSADYSNEKRVYDQRLVLAELRNGFPEDVGTIDLEWSMKYKTIEKKFGDVFARVNYQVEGEVIKEVIKELPRCNK